MKVLLNPFDLNGHTVGFRRQAKCWMTTLTGCLS